MVLGLLIAPAVELVRGIVEACDDELETRGSPAAEEDGSGRGCCCC